MQCLVGTFIHELKEEVIATPDFTGTLYPVQIIIPTLKSRIVYFRTSAD
jgi:hypothetical protein